MGAIFCHTNTIRILTILIISITWGTQNWNGGIPNFIAKEIVIRSIFSVSRIVCNSEFAHTIPMNIRMEAIACTVKYLIDVEEFLNLILYINRGINAIRLISRQIQLISHLLDDIIITVLDSKKKVNIRFLIFINIKKRNLIHS